MSRKDDLKSELEMYRKMALGEENVIKALFDLQWKENYPGASFDKPKPTKKRFPVAPQPKPRKIEL